MWFIFILLIDCLSEIKMIAKDPNAVVSLLFRNVLRIQIEERAAVVLILTTLDSVRQNQG